MADQLAARAITIAGLLEAAGGGRPKFVPTRRGASQFIFPNGGIIRFDLHPGQYSRAQGPHINLEQFPGDVSRNLHIRLQP